MSNLVIVKAPRCNYVFTEHEWNQYIKKEIPEPVLIAGLKRGKGWSRTEKGLNQVGSGKHKTYNEL